jgi:hypothetical protein
MAVLLKAADVGHLISSRETHVRWVRCLHDEIFLKLRDDDAPGGEEMEEGPWRRVDSQPRAASAPTPMMTAEDSRHLSQHSLHSLHSEHSRQAAKGHHGGAVQVRESSWPIV